MQSYRTWGPTHYTVIEKRTALSQVPGLRYGTQALANLPRPQAWDDKALSTAAKQSIQLVALANTVFDPRKTGATEHVVDDLDSPLLPIYQFCESRDATTLADLAGAPPKILQLLKQHQLLPNIWQYLHGRSVHKALIGENKCRIWADEEERQEMELCHPRSVEILKQFVGSVVPRSLFRALDVAGGNGRLAMNLPIRSYRKVDLFD